MIISEGENLTVEKLIEILNKIQDKKKPIEIEWQTGYVIEEYEEKIIILCH